MDIDIYIYLMCTIDYGISVRVQWIFSWYFHHILAKSLRLLWRLGGSGPARPAEGSEGWGLQQNTRDFHWEKIWKSWDLTGGNCEKIRIYNGFQRKKNEEHVRKFENFAEDEVSRDWTWDVPSDVKSFNSWTGIIPIIPIIPWPGTLFFGTYGNTNLHNP